MPAAGVVTIPAITVPTIMTIPASAVSKIEAVDRGGVVSACGAVVVSIIVHVADTRLVNAARAVIDDVGDVLGGGIVVVVVAIIVQAFVGDTPGAVRFQAGGAIGLFGAAAYINGAGVFAAVIAVCGFCLRRGQKRGGGQRSGGDDDFDAGHGVSSF